MTPADSRRRFVAAVEGRGGRFGYEESCKFRRGGLSADRCLVSFGRSHFGDDRASFLAGLRPLLAELGAPGSSGAWLAQHETGSGVVHFGFEDDGFPVHKLYLEYVLDARAALATPDGPPVPVIVHRALKWRVGTDRIGETIYRISPRGGATLGQRLAALAEGTGAAAALARDILMLALARAAPQDVVLLDVADSDSPRRSFDLQVYDAQLRLADVAAAVRRLARDLDIPERAVDAFLEARAATSFGHVAGGLDAVGLPFATLYYGARERGAGER